MTENYLLSYLYAMAHKRCLSKTLDSITRYGARRPELYLAVSEANILHIYGAISHGDKRQLSIKNASVFVSTAEYE